MKVLIITGSFPQIKCGVGDYTKKLFDSMKENSQLDTFVLTSNDANCCDNKVFTSIKKWKGIYIIKEVLKYVRKINPDVIHFQFPTSEYKFSSLCFFIFLPILLRLKRKKIVYTLHEYSDSGKIIQFFLKTIIRMSNRLIVVDERFKKDICVNNFIKCNKIQYIPIGSNIDKSTLSQDEINAIRFKILKEKKCDKIISYFGFVNESKCLCELFSSLGVLKENGLLNSCLLIIGDFNSDKCSKGYYLKMVDILKKYQLMDNIYITGFCPNNVVADYLKCSDFAVLPFKNGVSLRNGSMLAAYQEGLKIITTRPKNDEVFFKQEQFVLIDNSVDSLYSAILDCQFNSSKFNNTSNSIGWDSIVNKHINVYNSICKKNNM